MCTTMLYLHNNALLGINAHLDKDTAMLQQPLHGIEAPVGDRPEAKLCDQNGFNALHGMHTQGSMRRTCEVTCAKGPHNAQDILRSRPHDAQHTRS
jgi:hypothetical protein